jgi:2-dehydropantoate 2-reductase
MRLDSPRIAILGPGAVGGLIGAVLARRGYPVVCIATEGTAARLARDGIRVESGTFGTFSQSMNTTTRLSADIDACFITVKAVDLDKALTRVPVASVKRALIIPLLNGLDHMQVLRSRYPPGHVVGATIRIEASRDESGVIRHSSPFAAVDIAPLPAVAVDARSLVAEPLLEAGFTVQVRGDEREVLWEKLAFLAPLALLTTSHRTTMGVVRTSYRADLLASVREVAAVAQSEQVAINPADVIRRLDGVPESMVSSMYRDAAAGRPLELDAIGGAILRRAQVAGIDVPVTERLVKGVGRIRAAHCGADAQ